MAGITNFPGSLDTDSQLFDVTDSVSSLQAAHHNNMKESIKAIEAKIGANNTSVATTLDYRLGHPTGSHRHDGATGHGQRIHATTIVGLATYLSSPTVFLLPVFATSGLATSVSQESQMYYDSVADKYKAYANGTWRSLAFE